MQEKDFTIQELKENPSFRRMVRGIAKPEEIEYWNQWIESSDENREKAKEAIADIVGFQIKSSELPDIEEQWDRLRSSTVGRETNTKVKKVRKTNENRLRWIFRAIATLLLAGFVGFGTYYYQEQQASMPKLEQLTEARTVSTDQGEQKTLQFSNGSKIILNSYSSLTYRLGTSNQSTIEITLEGEAWFVADTNTEIEEPAFAVSTPDGIIRDIGTEFLVTVENEYSRVILQDGLVEVETLTQNSQSTQGEGAKFQVQKGEMVEFDRSEVVTRRDVNPTFYTSWATGYMELDESSVQEFAEYVENRFRVVVEIRDSGITDIRLNGTVYFRSLDELMRSVSEVIGISVYRSSERDTVYIGNVE